MMMAWSMIFGSALDGVLTVIEGFVLYQKIKFEESELEKMFGKSFQEFKIRTKRLIPFVF